MEENVLKKWDRINLMLPTFGRADTKLPTFIRTAEETVSDPKNIHFTFCVNKGDKKTIDFLRQHDWKSEYRIVWENLPKPHLAKYFNMMYDQTSYLGDRCLVSMLGDDMEFRTKGWDRTLLEDVNIKEGIGIWTMYDGYVKSEIAVNIFAARKFVNYNDFFMDERFPCDIIDLIWDIIARELNCKHSLKKVLLYHNHASVSGRDETFVRLRSQNKISSKYNMDEIKKIAKHQAKVIKKRMEKDYSLDNVAVVMNTYNRLGVLSKTVQSFKGSTVAPKNFFVFDDGSDNVGNVKRLFNNIDCKFFSEKHCGVQQRNLKSLKFVFQNGYKYVVILDSDMLLYSLWWVKAVEAIKTFKKDTAFNLFVAKCVKKTKDLGRGFARISGLCGCGLIISKEVYEKYLLDNPKNSTFDTNLTKKMNADNKPKYGVSPCFAQHIGLTEGVHIFGSLPAFSEDVLMNDKFKKNIDSFNKGGVGTVFASYGRFGDIIQASIVANMLSSAGEKVTFYTLPYYYDTLRTFSDCVSYKRDKKKQGARLDWGYSDVRELKKIYPGYKYYINAQFGSPENHDRYIGSGVPPLKWLSNMVLDITGIDVGDDWESGVKFSFRGKHPVIRNRDERPLAIIAPKAETSPVITIEMVNEFIEKYKHDYDVRILVPKRPTGVPFQKIKNWYIFNQTFEQAVYLVRKSALFIGNDSGLAWGGLFSGGKKIIYHNKNRLEKTSNYFNEIDKDYIDEVV